MASHDTNHRFHLHIQTTRPPDAIARRIVNFAKISTKPTPVLVNNPAVCREGFLERAVVFRRGKVVHCWLKREPIYSKTVL
jgi:hypothetical protein